MRLSALALLAILAISVLAAARPSASALSPVPFTTKATVTSTNTQFQRVYESGAGVYFLDANATHIQQTRYNVTGGTVTGAAARPVAAGTAVVTINHSEYYNYSNSTGWTQFGTLVVISGGQMQYNYMSGGSNFNRQEQYKALAAGETLPNTAWRGDFTFSYSSYVASPDAIIFGMAENTNWFGDGSSNDFLGVVFNGGSIQIYATDGASTTVSSTIAVSSGTTYYPRLERTSATSITLYVYTNSARTTQTAGSPVTLSIASTIQNLSYIVHGNRWGAGTGNLYTGVTDDLTLTWQATTSTPYNYSATSNVKVSSVETDLSLFAVSRNATANLNILTRHNATTLAQLANATTPSNYTPRDIAQSPSKLYIPLYEGSTNGKLHLGSANRDLTGYAQVSIYNGTVGNPAHGILMNVDAPNADVLMYSSGTTVFGEYLTANSALVGAAITNIGVYLKLAGSPTGSIAIGVFSTAGTQLFSCGSKDANTLTGGYVLYSFDCGGSYVLPAGVLIGVKYTGGNFPTDYVQAGYRGADVFDGANSVYGAYSGGFGTSSGADAAGLYISTSNVKAAVVDGSPDKKYVFFEYGTSSLCVVKHASSASTISTGLAHAAGRQYSIIPMSGKILVQTSAAVYELNTSTDAITTLYSKTFLTRYPQTFTIGPAARSYSSAPAYVADSAEAYSHMPSTGAASQVPVMVEQANNSTGALSPYAPAKYYFLPQNDLTVESSSAGSTTWTVKDPGTRHDLSLTTYKEDLGVNLSLDNTVLSQNVVRLVCGTGSYNVTLPKFAMGSDGDCTYWKVRDTASDPIGRQLPYARTKELVHANPYTSYNVHISVFQVGTFSATVKYNAKDIDFNIFDSGNNAAFRLLYGQCYDIVYKDVLSGQEIQSQRLCADDVFFKEAILSKTLGFSFWTSPCGAYHHYNATTAVLDTFVRHKPAPYDYNVKIYNKNDVLVVNSNRTAGQELDHQVYNLTSYVANKPLLLKIFNDEGQRIYQVYLDDRPLYLMDIALLLSGWNFAGWNILYFLPLIFRGMFTRNLAGVGAGMTGIFIAVLNWLGILPIPEPAMWGIVVVGVIGFLAYRRRDE